jgi:similar to spore coat protein
MSAGNEKMNDKDIALDMINSSKANVTTIAKVLTETTNPKLRETLRNQLTSCVNSHFRLSDIAISKGWYNAYEDPEQQLRTEISTARSMT